MVGYDEGYYDEIGEEKELICDTCGGKIEVRQDDVLTSIIHVKCVNCDRELTDLAGIADKYETLYEEAVKKYEKVSQLYNQLQDHLKCLITR